MNPEFIAIEGLHGAGKSTVVNLLAARLNLAVVPTVSSEFDEIRRHLDQARNIDARFSMVLSAVFSASVQIREMLACHSGVVVDSYFYRTIAFHRGMGSRLDVCIPDDAVLPSRVYFLHCGEVERGRRLKSRDKKLDYWQQRAENHAMEILNEYARFDMRTIDSTEIPPDEVAERIANELAGGNTP